MAKIDRVDVKKSSQKQKPSISQPFTIDPICSICLLYDILFEVTILIEPCYWSMYGTFHYAPT